MLWLLRSCGCTICRCLAERPGHIWISRKSDGHWAETIDASRGEDYPRRLVLSIDPSSSTSTAACNNTAVLEQTRLLPNSLDTC